MVGRLGCLVETTTWCPKLGSSLVRLGCLRPRPEGDHGEVEVLERNWGWKVDGEEEPVSR